MPSSICEQETGWRSQESPHAVQHMHNCVTTRREGLWCKGFKLNQASDAHTTQLHADKHACLSSSVCNQVFLSGCCLTVLLQNVVKHGLCCSYTEQWTCSTIAVAKFCPAGVVL